MVPGSDRIHSGSSSNPAAGMVTHTSPGPEALLTEGDTRPQRYFGTHLQPLPIQKISGFSGISIHGWIVFLTPGL
jgi:hypothetical protein